MKFTTLPLPLLLTFAVVAMAPAQASANERFTRLRPRENQVRATRTYQRPTPQRQVVPLRAPELPCYQTAPAYYYTGSGCGTSSATQPRLYWSGNSSFGSSTYSPRSSAPGAPRPFGWPAYDNPLERRASR